MQTSRPAVASSYSALQRRLSGQIVDWLRLEGMQSGATINQLQLAERLGVSRTPVKAALNCLSDMGAVRFVQRGVEVADLQAALPDETNPDEDEDHLITRLAADRHRRELPQEFSEADLMRRYNKPRPVIVAALRRLGALGVVSRKPGFGWRFIAEETPEEKSASYSFRMAIEPAALLEAGYTPDAVWLATMQQRHQRFLEEPWHNSNAMAFFEMNADFHLGLVSFSQNRFFIQATEQQNNLRRLRNYSWRLGAERVRVSCKEHLAILAALQAGKVNQAVALLIAHLKATSVLIAGQSTGITP
ncbi:MAG: FCD domain-containing protein [Beijerinckiaceae bacterium]